MKRASMSPDAIYDVVRSKPGEPERTYAKMKCRCGKSDLLAIANHPTPAAIVKMFERDGWQRISGSEMRCPDCQITKPKNNPMSELDRFVASSRAASVRMPIPDPAKMPAAPLRQQASPRQEQRIKLAIAPVRPMVYDEEIARRERAWLDAQLERGQTEFFIVAHHDVTPELAVMLMANNPKNRPFVATDLNRYKQDMLDGRWTLNGETIKVANTSDLNDGQHRLSACISTGVTFPTSIAFGAERDSRTTVDQGTKRTAAHILVMDDVDEAGTRLAAAGRFLFQMITFGAVMDGSSMSSTGSTKWPTRGQIVEIIKAHPALANSLRFGIAMQKARLGGAGMHAAMHYLISIKAGNLADDFYECISTGLGMRGKADPIYALRKRLLGFTTQARTREQAHLTIKAWNHWVAADEVTSLRVVDGEPFPSIKD